VLREYEWSETSQVVVLLARAHGKVRGLAKGSKRLSPSSLQRYSGGIGLLTAGHVVATTRRTAELATITEWDQQDGYAHLRADLRAQRLAMYAAEATAAMLADADPHPRLYDGLLTLLEALARPGKDAALLAYQWALLDECGYRPELNRDVVAGGDLPGARAYTFDPINGGLTTTQGAAGLRVRAATVTLLRGLAGGSPLEGVEPDALVRANRLLCVYLRALLGRELNTMRVVMGA